ncbi:hypothetical protein ACS0PU_011291 [Formica fusca]
MNQKNHFVSIYQKDYTWPHVLGICQTELPPKPVKVCACTDSPRVLKELLDASLDRTQTRQLSKPKICSKTRPILHAIQFDRPSDICMRKLEEECPDLNGLLEKICSDERTARTDADRFKTTYQAHYSDPAAARMTQRDLARAIIHTGDQQLQCRMPIKITIETDCPPHCQPSSSRVNANLRHDYKRKNGSKRGKRCEIGSEIQTSLPSWKTEYQDSISKIGHAIMRVKLHHAKKKTFPLQYQRCISD